MMMTEEEILKYVDMANKVRERSYSPYSGFGVGAVLIDDKNRVFKGVNVENGSYGLTNCAERTAIFSAVTEGMKRISLLVITADTTGPVSPCGACRQVISEFADDNSVIILANVKREYKIVTIDELLPYRFQL